MSFERIYLRRFSLEKERKQSGFPNNLHCCKRSQFCEKPMKRVVFSGICGSGRTNKRELK